MPSIFHTVKRRIERTQRRRDIADTIGLKAGLITRESLFFLQFDQLTRVHSIFRFECNPTLLLFSFDIQLVALQCQQFYKFRTYIRKRERSKTMELASSVRHDICLPAPRKIIFAMLNATPVQHDTDIASTVNGSKSNRQVCFHNFSCLFSSLYTHSG